MRAIPKSEDLRLERDLGRVEPGDRLMTSVAAESPNEYDDDQLGEGDTSMLAI